MRPRVLSAAVDEEEGGAVGCGAYGGFGWEVEGGEGGDGWGGDAGGEFGGLVWEGV